MAQVAMRSSDRDWPPSAPLDYSILNRLQPPQQCLPPVQQQPVSLQEFNSYPQQQKYQRLPASRGLRTSLAEWGLPPAVVAAYTSQGVTQLFPWQAAALENGEDGHNLVYCAPTSGGKSLVADILMIRKMIGLGNKNSNNNNNLATAGNASALMPPPPPPHLQTRGLGRALVVLPYISIVSEKTEHLSRLLRPIKTTVRGYYGAMDSSSSSPLAPNGEAVAVCTIEKANVCINRLLQEGRLAELSCIVIDELHMIANPQRGVGVELLLSKILHQKDVGGHIQIIGMSATMGGLESLRKWLRARLFLTNYRPVPLTEYAVFNGTVYKKLNKPNAAAGAAEANAIDYELGSDSCPLQLDRVLPPSNSKEDPDRLLPLVSEVTAQGHSVLIFCGTRRNCEVIAAMVAKHLDSLFSQKQDQDNSSLILSARQDLISQIEDAMSAPVSPQLRETILAGAAWHHAGLSQEEKSGIEAGYRAGTLQVLAATSTLAAGVNLPARRVILRSSLIFGRAAVDRAMYLQMVGRAGRAGQSPIGEAYIIGGGTSLKQKDWVAVCRLITAPVPVLQSQLLVNAPDNNEQQQGQEEGQSSSSLATDAQLQRLLLESVASGAVSSSADVQSLLHNTFAYHQHPWTNIVGAAKNALRALQKEKRLLQSYGTKGSLWKASNRGVAVYDSALPLDAGLELFNELLTAEKGFNTSEPIHAIFLALKVVKSAGFITIYNWNLWNSALTKLDSTKAAVAAAVGVDISYAHSLASGDRGNAVSTGKHARFAAALIINEVAKGEDSFDQIVARWGAPQFLSYNGLMRGELQKLQEDVAQHMGMAALLCESAGWWPLATMFSDHAATVAAGVRRELLPLMAVPGMTAGKARALWKGGITGPMVLATVQEEVVLKALTTGVAAQMRTKAVGAQRQQQQSSNLGTKAAKGVASRAAKALIAAAREHVVACVELNIAVEPQATPELPPQLQKQQQLVEGPRGLKESREIFLRNHCFCTEIRLSTSDDNVIKFLKTWAEQPRFSFSLATSLPAAAAATSERVLQGFSVCWDRKEAYFVDFSQRHRARELQFTSTASTLEKAVASIMASSTSEVILFGAFHTMNTLLHATEVCIGGNIFDLEVAARLLTPTEPASARATAAAAGAPAPPPHTLKSMLDLISPELSKEIRVAPNPRAGVTPACRSTLLLWAATEPALRVLASRGLVDYFNSVDLPASIAMSRGITTLLNSTKIARATAAKALPSSSKLFSILDSQLFPSFLPMHFGPQHVRVHTSTVQHELSTKILTPEGAQGAIVSLWCTPKELHNHRLGSSPAAAPLLLVLGRILNIQRGKRLRTALDFFSALDNDQQKTQQIGEEERGCSVVSLAVSPLPLPGCDPDSPVAVPCFIELVRPADQLWRLTSEAVSGLKFSSGSLEQKAGGAAAVGSTICEVLAWQPRQPPSSASAPIPSLAQLETNQKYTWLSIEIQNIDLAVLAHLSQDIELLNACAVPKPWSRVAAVWSVAARGVAVGGGVLISSATVKYVVQFLIHGWSAARLAQELSSNQQQRFSKAHASMTAASFVAAFQGLENWQERTVTAWERSHQVISICGRVYHLPGAAANADPKLKARLAKAAVAAMLSGSVEDVLLAAVATLNKSLAKTTTGVKNGVLLGHQGRVIIMQVADEQELQAVAAVGQVLKSNVELGNNNTLSVPLDISIGVGKILHPLFMRNVSLTTI
ncbi:putative Helicase and polymerase-containing protein TEBICHI [Nannochloris sp. 'desiccata']|nr:putative Helicase and polymerase-containing protein TEBICHI [Chlorella desiccata (nom. nud.)]